tara:strand:+ start:262 stop:519 length:258 start_codon:yes stop_codon:yes gene_type:complete
MKLFFYKTIIICVCLFVLFQITIGMQINRLESEINKLSSKENIEHIKNKIRSEMNVAIKKDRYLTQEDAALIRSFINKIQKEIKN